MPAGQGLVQPGHSEEERLSKASCGSALCQQVGAKAAGVSAPRGLGAELQWEGKEPHTGAGGMLPAATPTTPL